jgi:hypothetical protein
LLSALLLLLPYLWARSQVVTFDDLRVRHSESRSALTPVALWASVDPGGTVLAVAHEPGGAPLEGEWSPDRWGPTSCDVLEGAFVVPAPGEPPVPWRGECVQSREHDGALWHLFVRSAVPADFDVLGCGPELAGRWNDSSGGDAFAEFRLDGSVFYTERSTTERWAGSGEVLLMCEESAWRRLRPRVYVRNSELERWFSDEHGTGDWRVLAHDDDGHVDFFVRRRE